MKALSIRQPMAHAVATGAKTIENRPQPTNHRGTLAIHAGSNVGDDWTFEMVESLTGEPVPLLGGPRIPQAYRMSAVIAVVDLVDVHSETTCNCRCSPWALTAREYCGRCRVRRCTTDHAPLWHYELANPRALSAPVPTPGRLGVFSLPDASAKRVSYGLTFDRRNPNGILS